MLHQRNALAALIAALITLSLASSASAATTTHAEQADAILSNVAAHVSHGFANYHDSYEQMEATIAAGGHVSVLCGQVSYLGARALGRAGIPVRFVGAFSDQTTDLLDVPQGILESHAMIEVWTGSQWAVYDLDGNVQPVDENGQSVTVQQFASMTVRHYRTLATDAAYDPADDQYPLYESRMIFGDHEGYYDRVLKTVIIQQAGYYVYAGPAKSFLAGQSAYVPVPAANMSQWAAEPPAQAPVVAPPAAPESLASVTPTVLPSAAPVTSAVVSPAQPKRRFVTKVRHGKVFHVYGTGRKARWMYVRRAASRR